MFVVGPIVIIIVIGCYLKLIVSWLIVIEIIGPQIHFNLYTYCSKFFVKITTVADIEIYIHSNVISESIELSSFWWNINLAQFLWDYKFEKIDCRDIAYTFHSKIHLNFKSKNFYACFHPKKNSVQSKKLTLCIEMARCVVSPCHSVVVTNVSHIRPHPLFLFNHWF